MQSVESPETPQNLIQLDCTELLIGMFVCELDRPWAETPFPPGGFHLKKAESIQMLGKFCKSVQIDISRGAAPAKRKRGNLTILSSARKASPASASIKVNRSYYPVSATFKQQLDDTDKHYQRLLDIYGDLTLMVRGGQPLDLHPLQTAAKTLIEAILANPQTLIWCLNTDPLPVGTASHSVRAAGWATLLARQIGMIRSEIEILFLGTLLADIGLHLLPLNLMKKQRQLSKEEFLTYKKHVRLGAELLTQYPELDQQVIRIVRGHHERNDGLGFPKGLRGAQIPALARFANLAYCFERLLRTQSNGKNVSPAKAIARLYKQRELKFPEQLVVEFIHLMGMYPIGTLIELNTGEVAIVLEQHSEDKLNPKIAVLSDDSQRVLSKPRVIQLGSAGDERSVLSSLGPVHNGIKACDYRFSFIGKRIGFRNFGLRF